MALTYLEKMQVSQRLLDAMRLRLAGKKNSILPPDGVVCIEDPADISLVGSLAPAPDPDYHREQAPSARCVEAHRLDEPLDIDTIELGSYKGLIPFDRWVGIYPDTNICTDITRPKASV